MEDKRLLQNQLVLDSSFHGSDGDRSGSDDFLCFCKRSFNYSLFTNDYSLYLKEEL
jgi:hypothetical protein